MQTFCGPCRLCRGDGNRRGRRRHAQRPDVARHALRPLAKGLVVSLGVDARKDDPISFFKLGSPDITDFGQRIGHMGLPTVFCMEGGYAIEQVGVNTVNVLLFGNEPILCDGRDVGIIGAGQAAPSLAPFSDPKGDRVRA